MNDEIDSGASAQDGLEPTEKRSTGRRIASGALTAAKWGLTPLPALESMGKAVSSGGRAVSDLASVVFTRKKRPRYESFQEIVAQFGTGSKDDAAIKASYTYYQIRAQLAGVAAVISFLWVMYLTLFINYWLFFSLPLAVLLWAAAIKSAFLADVIDAQDINLYASARDFIRKRGVISWLWLAR